MKQFPAGVIRKHFQETRRKEGDEGWGQYSERHYEVRG